jgi:hypothetical protein
MAEIFLNLTLSQSGAPAAPDFDLDYLELLLISYVKPKEKYFAFEPRTGTKCQLHSQGKLTTPRSGNRKIRHEDEI